MENQPILSIRNLTKKFGGLTAVDDIDLDVYPGEVVALLGDNGAGKSTLVKCVSGVHLHTTGRIIFQGEEVNFSNPIEARDRGIETIYQDLALANNLDVAGNIFLGREREKNTIFGSLIQSLDDKFMLDRSGEALATVVAIKRGRKTTAESIQQFLTDHIARFKVPEHVWLQEQKLPRIASGKINKRQLRETATERLEKGA